jgi:hypothetical protein
MRRAAEEHLTNGVLARLAVSPQATAQPISGVPGLINLIGYQQMMKSPLSTISSSPVVHRLVFSLMT